MQKGFINILIGAVVTVVIVGVGGYFFITTRQPSEPLPQSQNVETKDPAPLPPVFKTQSAPTTSQNDALPPKNSVSEKPTLFFVKPKGAVVANPGEIVAIELHGTKISEVMLVGAGDFVESKKNDGTGVFTFQYPVPRGATGAVKLGALGKTSDDSLAPPPLAEITINVSLANAGKIISMHALEDRISLSGVGETAQLRIYGTYTDGVEREITSTSFGTTYTLYPGQPFNTEIIRVDDAGKITSVNAGQRSIVITNKNYSGNAISVTVFVQ